MGGLKARQTPSPIDAKNHGRSSHPLTPEAPNVARKPASANQLKRTTIAIVRVARMAGRNDQPAPNNASAAAKKGASRPPPEKNPLSIANKIAITLPIVAAIARPNTCPSKEKTRDMFIV